jgi:glucokinase
MDSMQSGVLIGIDVGGTEIKGGIVALNGLLQVKRSVRTPIEEGKTGIMREIITLIGQLMEQNKVPLLGIGIGSAGRIDPISGRVVYATDNLPGWMGTMITDEIALVYPEVPIYVDNDVNAAAIGEAWVGAAQGYDTYAFIALGTGVGGAAVSRGHMLHGVGGGAGEFGHLIVHPGGVPCNCGQRGCLEQYVSGSALNRIARQIDPDWNSYRLMEYCEAREERANAAIDAFVDNLAVGILNIANMLDPSVIVIGGGLISSSDVWWPRLEASLHRMTERPVKIVKAEAGNDAGIIGAARLSLLRDSRCLFI